MSDRLVLENDFTRLEFAGGHLGLCSMLDKLVGVDHVVLGTKAHLLWELVFKRGNQEQKLANTEAQCTDCSVEVLPDGMQRALMKWERLSHWREDNALSVTVTVDLPQSSGIAHWRISVENNSTYWGLWEVRFPCFSAFLAPGEYDFAYASNNWGFLRRNLAEEVTPTCIYPSFDWAMPFVSATRGGDSVYVAALDPDVWAKTYYLKPGEKFYVSTYVEDMAVPGSDYPGHYAVSAGVYQGDWLTACKIYRQWALRQYWTREGPLSGRADVPRSLKEVGLWFRASWEFKTDASPDQSIHEQNLPLLEAQEYNGVPCGLHWYLWHHNKFDCEYPYFFPAKPGFKERVAELVANGLLIMPYINTVIADYDHPRHKMELLPAAMKDQLGVPYMNVYGAESGRMTEMCPVTKAWRDAISGLVDRLTGECGVNAVYLDLLTANPPRFCFDESHGHPLGGGNWYWRGNQELLAEVRQIAVARGVALTSESIAEPYMNGVAAYLTWAPPLGRDIPMMPAVYSGYALYVSSPADLRMTDQAFFAAQGRVFTWGCQNGWMDMNLHLEPGHRAKAEHLKRIAQYRMASHKFLTYGELLSLLPPSRPVETITVVWPDYQKVDQEVELPSVLAALWRAEDGSLGVFLVNCLDAENEYAFRISAVESGLDAGAEDSCVVTRIAPEGRTVLGACAGGTIERTEALGAYEIRVLEIAPAPTS